MATRTLKLFRFTATCLLSGLILTPALRAQEKKKAPAPTKAPATKAPATSTSKTSTSAGSSKTGSTSASSTGKTGAASGAKSTAAAPLKPGTTVKTSTGGTKTMTAHGAEVTKTPSGKVESVKTASGSTAKFNSAGKVKEVHDPGRNMTVSRGPGGMRRTEVERSDHTRLVAEGHGRGYIQRPYTYGGRAYYSRAYYYNGHPYNAYYRGYYYHGGYYNGYMPAYYYPPVYYGWAYNPWPAPVPYAWGWGGNPWYGYYGAYFAPYPVYPSAAYWITDYLVAASLANAYASLSASARMYPNQTSAHLIYASYDPATGATSPSMTKEVKDAVAEEVRIELALQKAAGSEPVPASLKTLLDDGKPHVFVASSGLTVSSGGQDCGLTEGDVLSLPTAPAGEASTASLSVLASKQTDCPKGNTVEVNLTDLQEMQNHLMSSIDQGMAQMKDHPGQGGLPAPPAEAISGTKQAPYAAAAPAPDPNGAAELDQQAQQGAEVEKQVIAEADTGDGSAAATPAGTASEQPAAAAPRPSGTVAIAIGMTPEQVIANKGQPTNKFSAPPKLVYIYPDMKITFVRGKLTDVQ